MRAYRVTTPNEGARYTTTIKGIIELLNNDGWDWSCVGCFFAINNQGIREAFRPSELELKIKNSKAGLNELSFCQGFELSPYQWDDRLIVRDLFKTSYVTIEPITID